MLRILVLCSVLMLSSGAQTLKIVVQSPAIMKELQASGEIPPQVKLVNASGEHLTKEIVDADAFIGGAFHREATDLPTGRLFARRPPFLRLPLHWRPKRRLACQPIGAGAAASRRPQVAVRLCRCAIEPFAQIGAVQV